MSGELTALIATAASIAFIHTLMGPDHYLPFVAMAAARRWNLRRTLTVASVCGVGHILGSVLLGLCGIWLGLHLQRLTWIEAVRGDVAAWLLLGFGLAYLSWGLRRAFRARPHRHWHSHGLLVHDHAHRHEHGHAHVHDDTVSGIGAIGPWMLFVVFVLGPCEPLIPLLMYPAATDSLTGVLLVTAVFGVVTMLTLLAAVIAVSLGIRKFRLAGLERFGHAIAGSSIALCGASIVFLGL